MLETLSHSPRVFSLYNFMDMEEADNIIEDALGMTQEAYRLKVQQEGHVDCKAGCTAPNVDGAKKEAGEGGGGSILQVFSTQEAYRRKVGAEALQSAPPRCLCFSIICSAFFVSCFAVRVSS